MTPRTPTIYLCHATRAHAVKIGYTTNLENRLGALKTAIPGPTELLLTTAGDEITERYLHERFRQLRLNGEWFAADEPLITWARNIGLNDCAAAIEERQRMRHHPISVLDRLHIR